MNDTTTNLWDAIGIINGTCSDEVVIVGNHRDAWIIGGAADPNSVGLICTWNFLVQHLTINRALPLW